MSPAGPRRAVRWLVSGRVQAVGFRHFTRLEAERLGVAGTVANLPDGRVEIVAAADATSLAALELRLREGPPAGRVERLDEEPIADAGWTGFRVVFR